MRLVGLDVKIEKWKREATDNGSSQRGKGVCPSEE